MRKEPLCHGSPDSPASDRSNCRASASYDWQRPAYRPGAKLPNEPRLCELFGVSRTTLREAVRSLAAQGYVEVRRGSGTFVLDRASAPDIGLQRLESLRTRLRDLFEIRMMIEPQAARLAWPSGHR